MKFSDLSYRKKNKLLLLAGVVLLLVIYFAVIQRTIDLYSDNSELKEKIALAEEAPEKIGLLEKKRSLLNARLKAYSIDSLKNREFILHLVTEFCTKKGILLKDFPSPGLENQGDFAIETNLIIAEGGYHDLLNLLFFLEQEMKIGRPGSVKFIKKFDNKRKKEVLTIEIYLQNIIYK